jgi:adenylate cyclase
MTAGKYFNRAVIALDAPHIGFVVRETPHFIVVFGERNERYDIPISKIQHVSKNVLVGLNFSEITREYKVPRESPLPTSKYVDPWGSSGKVDLTEYMRRYGKTLFNKGVRLENEDHVGHVMKETDNKIVVFGEHDYRFDVPKSKITFVGRNVILGIDWNELFKYKVDKNSPLPNQEPLDKLAEEEENLLSPNKIEEKDKKKQIDGTSNAVLNRMIGDSNPRQIASKKVLDLDTLSLQRQDRFWDALKERYQYNTSIKRGQDFLLKHVSSKIPLVIIFVDLVGSTKMSMTLPADKLVTIIRAFSYEISSVVESYEGYVLKYVGDAVISFFPSGFNRYLTYDKAVRCAESMITVIKEGINPVLSKEDYPELKLKIGMDEGENVIVQYGYDRSSQIDILGYTMNVAAKITSHTGPNCMSVGHNIYKLLHPKVQANFKEISNLLDDWKYLDSSTGELYKVYTSK